jgi:hypothetical protein
MWRIGPVLWHGGIDINTQGPWRKRELKGNLLYVTHFAFWPCRTRRGQNKDIKK